MTHRGGPSLNIIIWRIGGGGPSFFLPRGPKIFLAVLIVSDLRQVDGFLRVLQFPQQIKLTATI
jgi:hypothetical protein